MCHACCETPSSIDSPARHGHCNRHVTFNPAHRWTYFPNMARHEALLIKVYDAAEDGRARFTIHTAFDDPTSPPDAPPRESIETRTFVFF